MISTSNDTSTKEVAGKSEKIQTFPVKELHLTSILSTCSHKLKIQQIQGMICLKIREKLIFAEGKNFYRFKSCTNTHKKGVVAFLLESWDQVRSDLAILVDLRLRKVVARVKVKSWKERIPLRLMQ